MGTGKRVPGERGKWRRAALFGLLFAVASPAPLLRAAPAPSFAALPPEQDVRIAGITVKGLAKVPEAVFRKTHLKLQAGREVKVLDIRKALSRIRGNGYYTSVGMTAVPSPGGWLLQFLVVERPLLTDIKIGGDYLCDLAVLDRFLTKRQVMIGKIFNEVSVRRALQEYREYLQSRGEFLFQIRYRAKQDIGFSEKWFRSILRISDERPDEPIYLKLYFFKLDHIVIDSIKVEGNIRVKPASIIRHMGLSPGDTIHDNQALVRALHRLNRLGIFSYVFFDIAPRGLLQKAHLVVRVKEIESDIVNTSISLNSRDDFNLELDYFNYSIGDNLARFSAGAVFDFKKESVNFVSIISLPKLFNRYFLNFQIKRDGLYTPIVSGWEKLTETVSLDLTFGRPLTRFVSLYGMLSYLYTDISFLGSGALPGGFAEDAYHSGTGKLFAMLDSLDDNFYPTTGIRTILSLEFPLLSELDNYLIIDHKLELYFPLQRSMTFAFYGHTGWLITDDPRLSLTLEERRKTTAQDRLAEGLNLIRMTAYACMEFRWRLLDQFAVFFYGETAGAWGGLGDIKLRDLQFGIGLGLRIAPRQHYYAHIFKYPWSFSFGYNISSRQADDLSYTIVSSRDEYYYINLQASF